MSRKDDLTEREGLVGNNVSHSKRRKKTKKELNLQKKSFNINGRKVRLKISTKTLKTISKNGLPALLKKLKIIKIFYFSLD